MLSFLRRAILDKSIFLNIKNRPIVLQIYDLFTFNLDAKMHFDKRLLLHNILYIIISKTLIRTQISLIICEYPGLIFVGFQIKIHGHLWTKISQIFLQCLYSVTYSETKPWDETVPKLHKVCKVIFVKSFFHFIDLKNNWRNCQKVFLLWFD